jgi:hypothetical protein
MPKPEEVLVGTTPASELIHPIHRIPVTFRTHPMIDNPMVGVDDAVRGILAKSPDVDPEGFVWSTDMPVMGSTLFNSNRILENTLAGMNVTGKPESIDFCHLQAGAYASHLFYSVQVNGEAHNFVAYVSRFPAEHSLGPFPEVDFKGLKNLRRIYDALPAEVRKKYDVATPYSFGHAKYNGIDYPVFTTKFEEDGELGSKFEPVVEYSNGVQDGLPVFRHPIPIGEQMSAADRKQMEITRRAINKFAILDKSRRGLTWEGFMKSNLMQPEIALLKKQQREVLKAAALTFVASGGFFPHQFSINSGDLMTSFNGNDFGKFTLITARGGLKSMHENVWISEMMKQKAVGSDVSVFAQLNGDDYRNVLIEVEGMVYKRQ